MTALMIAAELGLHEILILLLERHADCRLVDKDGYSALVLAAWNGNSYAVECLCKYDRSHDHLEIKNKYGKTAFFLSAEKDDVKSLDILWKYGADTNSLSKRGLSPLMLVCVLGKTGVFTYLVSPQEKPVASLTLTTLVDKVEHNVRLHSFVHSFVHAFFHSEANIMRCVID